MHTYSIKIEDAQPGMKITEPVYIVTNTGTNMLAARPGTVLDEKLIQMLTVRKVGSVTVESNKPPTETVEAPPTVNKPPTVVIKNEPPPPPPEKFVPVKTVVDEKMKEEAVSNVKQMFDCFAAVGPDGNVNKTTAYRCVENVESVVGDLLSVITDDATGLVHINDLKDYDEYTYHHSLSVSLLSIATGRELGLDKDSLFRLGRCAMLHDMGKQLIPLEIINKKGKLSDEEFATIKNHPVLGASSLKKAGIGDVELWNGVMFHHEKVNGSGYPKGLKGKDIPIFAKIISVADVYDAVTSYRSYRNPMLPSKAFEIISQDINTAFELDIVKAFFSKLELYPANSVVELSDGRLGIIVGSEGATRLRPILRVWGSTELINLAASTNSGIEITSVMSPEDLPPGYEFT
jgi:putative nucleotidyltransferase with HDIG domain